MKSGIKGLLLAAVAMAIAGCAANQKSQKSAESSRADVLRHTLATYCGAPRFPNGRIDVDLLVRQVSDVGANTYSFCIHAAATDWDDLKLFLPKAREHGIRVWASVVPPSESPPRVRSYAEPFKLDYQQWAVEFARLSIKEPNLVAWSIDDFTHNQRFYTPEYVRQMLGAARAINPRLAFAPCCYYKEITPQFVTNYCKLLDGFLFPYRHESQGANLKDPSLVCPEIAHIRSLSGPQFPIVLDIYASAHSHLGATTPDYVKQALETAHGCADGIMIYRHQDPVKEAEKYQIVRDHFLSWRSKN
jgi:hypothetical protein